MASRLTLGLTQLALAAALVACGPPCDPPSVTAQPADQSVLVNGTARFVVQATGDDLTYQWQRSTDGGSTWSNVSGATQSTLALASVSTTQDGHLYRARVTGECGEATTTSSRLTVQSEVLPPRFTVNLASPAEVTAGAGITLAVTAAGTSLTYQWETSAAGSSSWSALSGNNSPQLLLQNLPLSDNGRRYRVTISNSADSVTSQTATLSVKDTPVTPTAPTVTTQPAAVGVTAPNAATFTVAVNGYPAPTVHWQSSATNSSNPADWTDISGANDLTYRIASTNTGLSGRYYRAKVTNSAGTAYSQTARLTVTATPVAPSISTQPANQTVTVGAQATFTVAATGTPTPTIQWQVKTGSTWANINSATSATYTVTTTAVGTSQYRAVVTNGVSPDATSDAATLTVNAASSSALSGRTWRAGSLIENSTANVRTFANLQGFEVRISDDGLATAIFMQADALGRKAIQVSDRGAGTDAIEPSWSNPIVVDAAAPIASGYRPRLAVSPNGNALITWVSEQTCGSDSYGAYVGQAGCMYIYSSRRLAGSAAWDAPVKVVSSSMLFGGPIPMINDRGDAAILMDGTPGMSNTISSHRPGIAMRTSSEATYRVEYLANIGLGDLRKVGQHVLAGLDRSGNITVVSEQGNDLGTDDIVAYRGTVASGFGSTPVGEALEDRAANASLIAVRTGVDGHVAAVWQQDTGSTRNAILLSARSPAAGTWQPRDLSPDIGTSLKSHYALFVADGTAGNISFYNGCTAIRRVDGTWQMKQALPSDCGLTSTSTAPTAIDRNGNYIGWYNSQWLAYDGMLNKMIKALPSGTATSSDYVLGVAKSPRGRYGNDQALMALSPKGFGVALVLTGYTKMPSAAEPNGDMAAVDNLWGFYFK
jgi:hypothetical protein